MDPLIVVAVFPIIFIGELPDKTMFASLVMATRGRPLQVWVGAAGAFAVHVVIATTVGVALFALLPKRAVEAAVAALFLFGAVYAWREGTKNEDALAAEEASKHGVVLTAFIVIFVAEWGDLTQILTANRLFAIEGVAGSCRSVGGSLSGVVEVFQNGGSLRQPLWRPRPCATLPLLVLT